MRQEIEMYKELNKHLHQEMLQMFSATTTMLKEQNDFLLADAAPMEDIKELSANICMMATIQKAYSDSEDGPSYDSAFISKV
uniref:Uncharacterized protein n=1 Tax=Tanacetum cinerariifolium TaxID=118510 RepID=A0A699U9D5_TANCI|nr:hypothetical protein [Tanacetum cinerariifolium]